MQAEIKKLDKSQLEITVTVPALEAEPFLKKAAEKISKDAKVDGFRPGKAPYDVIEKKFGAMAIWQEAVDDIIIDSFYRALDENKIVSVDKPKIDIEKMAPGNDFVYKATVAILPKVTIGDYKNIKIKREKTEVKPAEIEKVIEEISRMRAKENLVDREAKTGDKVELDFEVWQGGAVIENGSYNKYPIVIGEKRFIPGFEEELIGLKAGAKKDFKLTFPKEYHENKLAGKEAEFKVVCLGVYERELPKIDDEFAQAVSGGQTKTAAELKKNIEENLAAEAKMKSEHKLEDEMFDKILAVCKFEEMPEVLIHGEAHKMVHELEDSIARQGLNFQDYLTNLKKTEEELVKEFEPQAIKRLKVAIAMREIYQEQKIVVTDEEIQKEIEEMKKYYPANPEVAKQFESEVYKDHLRNTLGNRKVLEYLKGVIVAE